MSSVRVYGFTSPESRMGGLGRDSALFVVLIDVQT
jgi:hypothetical protein